MNIGSGTNFKVKKGTRTVLESVEWKTFYAGLPNLPSYLKKLVFSLKRFLGGIYLK